MKARILYDGHPKGWCVELTCETEAEAAVLFELVRSRDNIGVHSKGSDAFNSKEAEAAVRVFRFERKEWDKKAAIDPNVGHYA